MSKISERIDKWTERSKSTIYNKPPLLLNDNKSQNVYVEGVDEDMTSLIRANIKLYFNNVNKDIKELANKFFIKEFKTDVKNIIAFGKSSEVSEAFLEGFIPFVTVSHGQEIIKSAKCYNSFDPDEYKRSMYNLSTCGLVVHETCLSSWLCILEKLGSPEYTIIYSKHKNDKI
jgi:hypothetical protein